MDDDDQLDEWIRNTGETLYHPVGTCKMGEDDMAVVNSDLQVHGILWLRVVDASIMPTLIGEYKCSYNNDCREGGRFH